MKIGNRDPLLRTKSDGVLSLKNTSSGSVPSLQSHSYSRNISPSDITIENLICQKMMRRRTGLSSSNSPSSSIRRRPRGGSGPIGLHERLAFADQNVSGDGCINGDPESESSPVRHRCVMTMLRFSLIFINLSSLLHFSRGRNFTSTHAASNM